MGFFSEIKGQDKITGVLTRAIQHGNISHAYLFSGPRGTGKKTTAQIFAQAILLEDDPGGKGYLRENVHPDYLTVERQEKKTLIGIEQITRELEPWLSNKPYRAKHRVAVIKEAHLLSSTAANALLKTLEEPPEFAVIILVSDENNLLETIVSRCQQIRFPLLPEAVIQGKLIEIGIEKDQARLFARLGQGSMSQALAYAQEGLFEEIWPLTRAMITDLASGKQIEVFHSAELMEKQPLIITLAEMLLRDLYVYQDTEQENLLLMPTNLAWYQQFKSVSALSVRNSLAHIADLKKHLSTSVNTQLIYINISYELLDALK